MGKVIFGKTLWKKHLNWPNFYKIAHHDIMIEQSNYRNVKMTAVV